MAEIYLKLRDLLESAGQYLGWTYRDRLMSGKDVAMPQPTYHRQFLDAFGEFFGTQLPRYQQLTRGGLRATNCVMFGEGLILGAAALSAPGRCEWKIGAHNRTMNLSGKDPRGGIEAYVAAGLADRVRDKHERPGRGDSWLIVQNDHHFRIIVAHDLDTDRCLTLEANVFIEMYHPSSNTGESGFVGHDWSGSSQKTPGQIGWGVPLDHGFLEDASIDGWRQHGPTWQSFIDDTRGPNLYWAKLHVVAGNRYYAPLASSTNSSAVIGAYSNNEKTENGFAGYYVIGLHRNLHGGVHLWPEGDHSGPDKRARVRAMAPGYIAAARLPPRDHPANDSDVLEHTHGWSGFVLVRHELEIQPPPSDERRGRPSRERHALYSLYMHLGPPSYEERPGALDPYVQPADGRPDDPGGGDAPGTMGSPDERVSTEPAIPWFHHLHVLRHGGMLRVRRGRAPHGKPEPPLGEFFLGRAAGDKTSPCPVHDAAGREALIDPAYFLAIPPAFDVDAVWTALRDGKVVTFSEPLLPVQSGGGIGWIWPLDEVHGLQRQSNRIGDGFLHFQVFAPAGAVSGIDALVAEIEQREDLGMTFQSVTEANLGPAPPAAALHKRFPDATAFKNIVLAPLAERDQTSLGPMFDDLIAHPDLGFLDTSHLVEFLDDAKGFAPNDWKTHWEFGDVNCYPVEVELDVTYLPLDSGNTWQIEFQFRGRGMPIPKVSHDLTTLLAPLVAEPVPRTTRPKLTIQVPAAADSVEIQPIRSDAEATVVDARDDREAALFRDMVKRRRWRDVKLTADNEWSPGVFADTVKAFNDSDVVNQPSSQLKRFADDVAKKTAAAYWCTPDLETPALRRSLADGGKPKAGQLLDALSGEIVALHPLTAVWSLALLSRHSGASGRKVGCSETFDSTPYGGPTAVPAWWSWVLEPDARPDAIRPGDRLAIIAVGDDFRYDPDMAPPVIELACCGKPLTIPAAPVAAAPAVYLAELFADFWGTCSLRTIRGAAPPNTIHGKPTDRAPVLEVTVAGDTPRFAAWDAEDQRCGIDQFFAWRSPAGLCFAVKFEHDAPAMLNGYAWLRWRSAGSSETPIEGMSRQLARMDGATALLAAAEVERRARRPTGWGDDAAVVFESGARDVIVRRTHDKAVKITAHYSWQAYADASSDVHVACSLAQRIQQLVSAPSAAAVIIELAEGGLHADGLGCTLRVIARRGSARGTRPPTAKELETQLDAVDSVGLVASKVERDLGRFDVRFDDPPETAALCRAILADGLGFVDSSRRFLRCAATGPGDNARVTLSFDLAAYRRATDRSGLRIRRALAEGLECLREQAGVDVQLVYVSRDGLRCRVGVPLPSIQAVRAHAARYFAGVVEASPGGRYLDLMVPPAGAHYGIVTVDPGQLIRDMKAELTAGAGGCHEYLLAFQPMVLCHKRNKVPYFRPDGRAASGDGNAEGDGSYSDLLAEVPAIEPAFQTAYAAGQFEPVGFPDDDDTGELFHLTWSSPGGYHIILDLPVRGSGAAWAHYQIGVTVDGTPWKLCPKVVAGRVKLDCGELPDTHGKEGLVRRVQLDTVLLDKTGRAGDFPLPRSFRASYSCTPRIDLDEPRLVGDEFVFTGRCHAVATPVPPVPPGTESALSAGIDHRAGQPLRLVFDADHEPPEAHELGRQVCYAHRPWKQAASEVPVGYCDASGAFSARLPAAAASGVVQRGVRLVAAVLGGTPFRGAGSLPVGHDSLDETAPPRTRQQLPPEPSPEAP